MCGLAGMLCGPGAAPPDFDELSTMVALLGHRGPDGYGLYRDQACGLAHARLSLIDLEGGFQPIRNQNGSLWLAFNGEIFNYLELRRALAAEGHRFYTEGDSEVIVHLYERYGEAAWAMLNGQFAFALWDRPRGRLWLVRDRVGILPLYYARVGNRLLFASEAKALFAGGRLDPAFDPAGLAEIFTTWTAAAPRSVFSGVAQLRPASALCVDAALDVRETRYWRPDPHRPDLARLSVEEAVDGLEAHLDRAVALRLRADVPVGAYISGGLDSSVIGSLARERVGARLETFGIGFADSRFDETGPQQRVSDFLGTRHHRIVCDGETVRERLEETVWHCETPLLRTSPVPLFALAESVRAAGMRTVLTGEGADELLAGYTLFKEDQIRRFWARDPASLRRPALLSRIHHYVGSPEARTNALWRQFFGRDLEATGDPFYAHRIRWHNTAWSLRFLAPEVRSTFGAETVAAGLLAEMPAGFADWDPLPQASWVEIHAFMSGYLLSCQGDRVAMAHGVEARYPFLDPEVIDFCLGLPKRHKLVGLRDKLALRRLAARRLPPEIAARRKQPFRAPIGPALFGREALGRFDAILGDGAGMAPDLARLGLIDGKAVAQLVAKARRQDGNLGEREEMALIGVLTLGLLARQFGAGFPARRREARRRLAARPCVVRVDHLAAAVDFS